MKHDLNNPMTMALELAKKAWGDTHPNPMVGAVIVENDKVVATGHHKAKGKDHAEVDALRNLGRKPTPEAALHVTLEPCCIDGLTPPCTQAIIESGIRNIHIGTVDPNPLVAGKGIQALKEAGIVVHMGDMEDECRDLNLLFNHWIKNQTPLLAGKVATTIDGRTATHNGHSKWITSGKARNDVMRWRRLFPAIAVGAGTVLADNPSLTSRVEGKEDWCPIRFVFDSQLQTWPNKVVYSDNFRDRTILVTTQSAPAKIISDIQNSSISVWQLPEKNGRPCLQSYKKKCSNEGINGVLIEGGSQLLSSFLNSGNLDYLFAYRAPRILGDISAIPVFQGRQIESIDQSISLSNVKHAALGDDQLLRGYINHP